jgi:hypothetical protein
MQLLALVALLEDIWTQINVSNFVQLEHLQISQIEHVPLALILVQHALVVQLLALLALQEDSWIIIPV